MRAAEAIIPDTGEIVTLSPKGIQLPGLVNDGIYRIVVYDRMEDYFRLGWHWCAPLGVHSCLMRWLCDCNAVEPTL